VQRTIEKATGASLRCTSSRAVYSPELRPSRQACHARLSAEVAPPTGLMCGPRPAVAPGLLTWEALGLTLSRQRASDAIEYEVRFRSHGKLECLSAVFIGLPFFLLWSRCKMAIRTPRAPPCSFFVVVLCQLNTKHQQSMSLQRCERGTQCWEAYSLASWPPNKCLYLPNGSMA
jgi:hypothetical protein